MNIVKRAILKLADLDQPLFSGGLYFLNYVYSKFSQPFRNDRIIQIAINLLLILGSLY